MEKTIIYTDGSSRGNPGRGGWGVVVRGVWGVKELGGREEKTTNNRMEMKAVIEAFRYLSSRSFALNSEFFIFCDSAYVINGATKWAVGWQANGWVTKNKESVLNKDLWEEMLSLISKFKIEWKQVAGHAGVAGNERCDEIATAFADGGEISLFEGASKDYKVDLSINTPIETSKKNSKSSAKAYSYVSKVEGKIYKDKTWKECEARVKGKSGVMYRKSFSKSDEDRIVSEFQG